MKSDAKSTIEAGKAILGIEFGSTRIKAVLIDQENKPIAQGSHSWENQLVDGLWTYSVEAIWHGLQDCYADLRSNVKKLYDTEIETLAAIGVSAMMHGYMAFNKEEEILVPFRTWRNTNTMKEAYSLICKVRAIFKSHITRKEAKEKLHEWYKEVNACTLREIKAARNAIKGKEEYVLN